MLNEALGRKQKSFKAKHEPLLHCASVESIYGTKKAFQPSPFVKLTVHKSFISAEMKE